MIFIMDVSGSMGEEQKEIVRIETFWIDTWLRSQYENLEAHISFTMRPPGWTGTRSFAPARVGRNDDLQCVQSVRKND